LVESVACLRGNRQDCLFYKANLPRDRWGDRLGRFAMLGDTAAERRTVPHCGTVPLGTQLTCSL